MSVITMASDEVYYLNFTIDKMKSPKSPCAAGSNQFGMQLLYDKLKILNGVENGYAI